jgi:hypothetical protein
MSWKIRKRKLLFPPPDPFWDSIEYLPADYLMKDFRINHWT